MECRMAGNMTLIAALVVYSETGKLTCLEDGCVYERDELRTIDVM